jgi:GDP-L-fucose synthase
MPIDPQQRILVTGHRGMVGGALVRALENAGASPLTAGRDEVDLTRQAEVEAFLGDSKPDAVVVAAAKVGGISANNTYPAEFIYDNLMIVANLIHGSYRAGVGRVLTLGSSCIYPKMAPQPLREDSLMTGPLEATNEAYSVAKIAGLKLSEFYRKQYGVLYHSAMPTNLYGPGDNYHAENSHVLPALLRRIHEAKESGLEEVVIWGTGTPKREFLHVDDLAEACLHLLGLEDPPDLVNVGSGSEVSILELAQLVARVVGYEGRIATDSSKPDGTPRKLLDVSLLDSLGWRARIGLEEGVRATYEAFVEETQRGLLRI